MYKVSLKLKSDAQKMINDVKLNQVGQEMYFVVEADNLAEVMVALKKGYKEVLEQSVELLIEQDMDMALNRMLRSEIGDRLDELAEKLSKTKESSKESCTWCGGPSDGGLCNKCVEEHSN